MSKYRQQDLIRLHAAKHGQTLATAENEIKNTLASLKEITAEPESTLTLRGFGRFNRTERKGYTGRNPATGQPIEVSPKQILRFKE